jgi:hypothetical protein
MNDINKKHITFDQELQNKKKELKEFYTGLENQLHIKS